MRVSCFLFSLWKWLPLNSEGEGGKGEVAVFCTKRRDRRSNKVLIESTTPFHHAQGEGPYRVSSPLGLTFLTASQRITPVHYNTVSVDPGMIVFSGMCDINIYIPSSSWVFCRMLNVLLF